MINISRRVPTSGNVYFCTSLYYDVYEQTAEIVEDDEPQKDR